MYEIVLADEPLNVTPLELPEPVLLNVKLFTTLPALPVVFWFNVGISAATICLKLGTPGAPSGAAKKVLAIWLPKAFCLLLKVFQSVLDNKPCYEPLAVAIAKEIVPLVVTGVEPIVTPVVEEDNPTLVTVPKLLV